MSPDSGGHRAFLGLGSNLGSPRENLLRSLGLLKAAPADLDRISSCYRTEPLGGPEDQPWFLNLCAEIHTPLEPRELLQMALRIESELGRIRGEPDAPRTIDIDILLYDKLKLAEPGLTVPHPRLHLRKFVLVPLAEIGGDVIHPGLGLTIGELLKKSTDPLQVVKGPELQLDEY